MTAPDAVMHVAEMLERATVAAHLAMPEERCEQYIEIAREWRVLALALAQHQAMSPRPRDDDR